MRSFSALSSPVPRLPRGRPIFMENLPNLVGLEQVLFVSAAPMGVQKICGGQVDDSLRDFLTRRRRRRRSKKKKKSPHTNSTTVVSYNFVSSTDAYDVLTPHNPLACSQRWQTLCKLSLSLRWNKEVPLLPPCAEARGRRR